MSNIDPAIVDALACALHADTDICGGGCIQTARRLAPALERVIADELTAALAERDAARAEVARLRAAVEKVHEQIDAACDAALGDGIAEGGRRLRDGSQDETVGAEGEGDEPLDPKVRDMAALAYLVVTCEALHIDEGEEWDAFMYARAIHRRIVAALAATEDQP